MKKRNLKAIFLSLLARRSRRAGDEPPRDRAAAASPQTGAASRSRIEPAEPDRKAPSSRAEAIGRISDRPTEKPAAPPEAWLAAHSGGPPAHWVERVRQGAPELLQERESNSDYPAPSDQSVAEVQSERAARDMSFDAPRGPISANSPDQLAIARVGQFDKLSHYHKPIAMVRPYTRSLTDLRRGASAEEKLSKAECDHPPETAEPFEAREPGDALAIRLDVAVEPRKNVETLQFQTADLDERRDRRWAQEESGVRRSESPKPAPVKPVEVTQWTTLPLITMEERIASHPGAVAPAQSPLQGAERVFHYPDVNRRGARKDQIGQGRLAFNADYRPAKKSKEEVTKPIEPQVTRGRRSDLYDVPADRWPALFEASPDDYFDGLEAAWRELNRRRRLSREQTGGLWSE